jgi:hypothetical protein
MSGNGVGRVSQDRTSARQRVQTNLHFRATAGLLPQMARAMVPQGSPRRPRELDAFCAAITHLTARISSSLNPDGRQMFCGISNLQMKPKPLRVLWPSSRQRAPKLRAFVDFLAANLVPSVEADSGIGF